MRKFNRFAILSIFLTLLFLLPACQGPQKYEETRNMWDTFITVTVYSDAGNAQKAITASFARLDTIGNAASNFDEKAEAFRLNRDGYVDNPSPDLLNLVKLS